MSAREDLIEIVTRDSQSSGGDRTWAEDLVDSLLHEEAEKIRASRLEAPEGFTHRESWVNAWNSGRDDSADLIDPYVT